MVQRMGAASTSSGSAGLSADQVAAGLRALEGALVEGRPDEAAAHLPGLLGHGAIAAGALDGAVRLVAQWHLGEARWDEAAAGLEQLHERSDTDDRHRTLARNLSAVQEHRPALYARLIHWRQSAQSSDYRFVRGEGGRVLLAQEQAGGGYTEVAPGGQFAAFTQQAKASVAGKPGYALAVLSTGDGYAVTLLAKNPPALYMDQSLTVHVIEPELDRLWMAMHMHDWAAESLPGGGPWRESRFRWHVGEDWAEGFRKAWDNDPWTPVPALAVCPDPAQVAALGERLRALSAEHEGRTAALLVEMKARYAQKQTQDWVEVLGENPPRPPRVAVMTSRFTTVLQYAARDTAAALERLGCEVEFLIEGTPHERFNAEVFSQLLRDFEPDLLLSIDATRHQLRGWVPEELPHLCWIQDALPQLMNEELGRAIGKRDFILTFFAPRLVGDHGYPARQCVDMPMMVTSPVEAGGFSEERGETSGPDLLYASNVSGTAAVLLKQSVARAPQAVRGLVEEAAAVVIAHYGRGHALPTEPDLDVLLMEAVRGGALPEHDAAVRRALRDALWNPLNTGLYRQQALGWVVEAAAARGLVLHVHGQGWAEHPEFSAYDQGPLDHAGLQAATSVARFALHLEPYICFTHHRMLDALQRGTPVLVRDHPGHFGLQRVAAFVAAHCPAAACDAQARAACEGSAEKAESLEAMLKAHRGLTWDLAGDVVAQVRCWQRAGVLPDDAGVEPALPQLEAVTFGDAAELGQRLDALSADAGLAARVVAAQRGAVAGRLTFDAAFSRVIQRVRVLLEEECTGQSVG